MSETLKAPRARSGKKLRYSNSRALLLPKPKPFQPFLTGVAKGKKLGELSDQANQHHQEAQKAWRGALIHAEKAGIALLEAKRLLGGRGKWTRWLTDRFDASRETARVYMRIARHRDDPRLVEARESGIKIISIKSVLDILRNKSSSSTGDTKSTSASKKAYDDGLAEPVPATELDRMKDAWKNYQRAWKKATPTERQAFKVWVRRRRQARKTVQPCP